MRLLDIFNPVNVAQAEAVTPLKPAQSQNENSAKPSSWGVGGGADTVSISEEARVALEAAKKERENQQSDPEEDSPLQEFKAYMKEAKGQNASDDLESLQKRLKALANKIAKLSQDQNMSDEARTSTITALQEQMQMIMNKIAKMA